jgi:hypothetical protein
MFTLTTAQSAQINAAEYTVNWEAEAEQRYEGGEDCSEELEQRFESSFSDYTAREDLGGLTVYLKEGRLVAFYDYERFVGTVF